MNLIELALNAGFGPRTIEAAGKQIERFAQLVRDQALEAAAKVCEEPYEFTSQEASLLATAIRQLKGKQ